MSSDLYSVLQISKTATAEEIRNAYKRRALATHPDRMPQNSTEEQRQERTELFRQVNNAYEVLNNKDTRKQYDRYGVWPPPETPPPPPYQSSPSPRRQRHGDRFSNPIFQTGFSFGPLFEDGYRQQQPGPPPPPRVFTFSDPFELFNQFFPEMGESRRVGDLQPAGRSMFGDVFAGFGAQMRGLQQQMGDVQRSVRTSGTSIGFSSGGGFTSSSQRTMSINGVTYSQSTYHDAQGNVHVKDVGPDGREVYTINGVPQNAIQPGSSQSHRRIEDYPTSRDRHSSSHRRHSSRQSSSGEKRDSHKSRDRYIEEKPRRSSGSRRDHDPYDYY